MGSLNEEKNKLRKALAEVHKRKDLVSYDDGWHGAVMNSVRRISADLQPQDFWFSFEQTAWRLAPAACMLIALLAVLIGIMDITPDYGLADAIIDDSVSRLISMAAGAE